LGDDEKGAFFLPRASRFLSLCAGSSPKIRIFAEKFCVFFLAALILRDAAFGGSSG
jgi:hypothetical protein